MVCTVCYVESKHKNTFCVVRDYIIIWYTHILATVNTYRNYALVLAIDCSLQKP